MVQTDDEVVSVTAEAETEPIPDPSVVFIARLDERRIQFLHRVNAQAVVEQWASERPGRTAEVEDWGRAKWEANGSGDSHAICDRLPDRRLVFHAFAVFRPGGERLDLAAPAQWTVTAWDFESDLYTERSAAWRTTRRPGADQLVEAQVRGTDKDAVTEAYELAIAQAVDPARNPGKYGDTSDW